MKHAYSCLHAGCYVSSGHGLPVSSKHARQWFRLVMAPEKSAEPGKSLRVKQVAYCSMAVWVTSPANKGQFSKIAVGNVLPTGYANMTTRRNFESVSYRFNFKKRNDCYNLPSVIL